MTYTIHHFNRQMRLSRAGYLSGFNVTVDGTLPYDIYGVSPMWYVIYRPDGLFGKEVSAFTKLENFFPNIIEPDMSKFEYWWFNDKNIMYKIVYNNTEFNIPRDGLSDIEIFEKLQKGCYDKET